MSETTLRPSEVLVTYRPDPDIGLDYEFSTMGDLRHLDGREDTIVNHDAADALRSRFVEGYWTSRGVVIDPEMSMFYAYSDDLSALREMVQALDNLAFNGYLPGTPA